MDDDFKRDAAAKLEAFVTSKTPAQKHSRNIDTLGELTFEVTPTPVSQYFARPDESPRVTFKKRILDDLQKYAVIARPLNPERGKEVE